MPSQVLDVLIIGGGQAGLSVAYYLRRSDLSFLILDDQPEAGGSWQHTWDTLRLFSPTEFSSIPGWQMPKGDNEYPHKDDFIAYLDAYEQRYGFPIERPTRVTAVHHDGDLFEVTTNRGTYVSRALVSATGTAQNPTLPAYEGADIFQGLQMHSSEFLSTAGLEGKDVAIVGAGNSGAQILAEVSKVANATWITLEEPHYLPDDIDGRYLFHSATRRFHGKEEAKPKEKPDDTKVSLSNIVMVESVKEARARDVLHAIRPFERLSETGGVWADGTERPFDVVIWCTGFRANLQHLAPLGLTDGDQIKTKGTRATDLPNLWLVGYGSWTGFASATIFGVQKTARSTAQDIQDTLA